MTDISHTDGYPPLSALNDLLFCERRCALHRIENIWVDNSYTIEGTHAHRRADLNVEWKSAAGREVHGLLLKSDRLRLTGKADVVEFHHRPDGCEVPYPVEYKRGKRRRWDNNDVQLCAQALCLEEMLRVEIPAGAIFHVQSKRRQEIVFTPDLRQRTEAAARRLHELLAAGVTPPPVLKARCRGCSLLDLCLPKLLTAPRAIAAYQQALFAKELAIEP